MMIDPQAVIERMNIRMTIRIVRCPDPLMWYADKVGREVIVERIDSSGLWSREDSGYINIIKFEDVLP